ncbi:MAG: helix-turn-helix transcriptional regulator [Betaproteobacteria bacterium]|nr:helix-turn-helix transcriptional regulator [Betaproteobacteria bacterium]
MQTDPREAGLSGARLERVLEFIEQNLEKKLSIEAISSVAHMSPFHFARLFKQATGHAPHGYLTRRRIERAKKLLRSSALPIVHVATSVGFQTQGHFTEVFRRYAGLTPRTFRLSAGEEEIVHSDAAWTSESTPAGALSPSSAREPGS